MHHLLGQWISSWLKLLSLINNNFRTPTMAEAASKLANINVEEADDILGMVMSGDEENAGGGATLTGVLENCRVTLNNAGGTKNYAKKKVKLLEVRKLNRELSHCGHTTVLYKKKNKQLHHERN